MKTPFSTHYALSSPERFAHIPGAAFTIQAAKRSTFLEKQLWSINHWW